MPQALSSAAVPLAGLRAAAEANVVRSAEPPAGRPTLPPAERQPL